MNEKYTFPTFEHSFWVGGQRREAVRRLERGPSSVLEGPEKSRI